MVRRRTPQRRRTPLHRQTPRRTPQRRRTPRHRQTPRRTPQRRQTPRRLIRKCDKSLKAGLSKKGAALGVAGIVGLGAASLVGVGAYTIKKKNKERAAMNPEVERKNQEKIIDINSYIDQLNNGTNDSNVGSAAGKVILVIGTSGVGKSSVINELTGKTTSCTVNSGARGGQVLCTATDDDNNLYIETIGLGTEDHAQGEKSLKDIVDIVMQKNGINLILFVWGKTRFNRLEELNSMLVKQLFPTVPVVVVRTGLDDAEDTEDNQMERQNIYKKFFQDQFCGEVFGTFKHIEFQNDQDKNKWDIGVSRSVAQLKECINKCASGDRIKTSFTDNIKNVFRHVIELGIVGLLSLIKKQKDPFQNQ